MALTRTYPGRIGIALDRFLNAVLLNGNPNETISTALSR
jgi:hypothetical protein